MSNNTSIEILEQALEKERNTRKQVEVDLEQKTLELYKLNEELKASNAFLTIQNQKKSAQLEGVFNSLADAYILMDTMGNVIEMNISAIEMIGYDIAMESINVVNLIYKEDYKYAMQSYSELFEKGFFKNYKARIYTKQKQIKRVHINASLVYNQFGKPVGAQGIIRDITEETEQRKIFEAQQQQLSIIVNNSPIGIALTQKGFFIEFNEAFQQILGYTKDELRKLTIKDISFKEDYEKSIASIKQLDSGAIDQFTTVKRYLCKNKSIVWAKTSVGAVRQGSGQIKYQVALIEDITEEYKETQLKKQLMADLKKSNELLNDFAHVISHDLKSPLRSINTLIYWLNEDYSSVLDANAKDILNKLTLKVSKMNSLISGVLDYSSVDKIKQPLEHIDIFKLVSDIIAVIYIPKNVNVFIPENLPIVKGDRFRLQQLFQNLLNNAVSYIDKQSGEVSLGYKDQETHWEFQIVDNGMGIDKKYQNKIFEVFQSLENSEHSTGIGLSIVKKIVTYYEGEIWLTSKVGEGTTFYFTLKK